MRHGFEPLIKRYLRRDVDYYKPMQGGSRIHACMQPSSTPLPAMDLPARPVGMLRSHMLWSFVVVVGMCGIIRLLLLSGDLGLPASALTRQRFHPLSKQPGLFHGGTWHDYQLDGINFLRNAW